MTLLALAPVLVCVAALVYFVAQDATAGALLVFGLPLVAFLAVAVAEGRLWVATRRIAQPLELSAQGWPSTPRADAVAFPWAAVAAVGILRVGLTSRLVVRLHPRAGPGAPGVSGTLTPAGWRIVRRRGLQLSLRTLQISPEELGWAVERSSAGRFRPLLPR